MKHGKARRLRLTVERVRVLASRELGGAHGGFPPEETAACDTHMWAAAGDRPKTDLTVIVPTLAAPGDVARRS